MPPITMHTLASLRERLVEHLDGRRVRADVALGPYTTFKVGGPADLFVELRSSAEMLAVLELARDAGVPVTMLGGGSNVLISDAGLRGLVVRVHGGAIDLVKPNRVRAEAGVTINGLVRWTIARGLAGLEAWAGTPGTVGGAIHGNAHFQGRLMSEIVDSVLLATRDGRTNELPVGEMRFGYDTSRVQHTGEVVLAVTFKVERGDPEVLRRVARASLTYRKRTQPLHMPSAGCIFQNPHPDDGPLPPGVPRSAGALVDHAGLKGFHLGGAQVSAVHGNFFVSDGAASAADIRALVEKCRDGVAAATGITLREEIVYLGDFGISGKSPGR
ncbi:MAG: UDP-N-acetylmuramate dehydrogenase [Luteitalea sp.]|nr:UDP-N-acetylmuramate dehydrogenase [Luteitalea sp.]